MRGSASILLLALLAAVLAAPVAAEGVYRALWGRATRLYYEGYDTVHAAYLIYSARYAAAHGDYLGAAWRLLEAAAELVNPPRRGRLNTSYRLVGFYASTVTPPPRMLAPVDTTYLLSPMGYLVYPNDSRWRLSCFIVVFVGRGPGGWAAYQGRLPFTPWERPFRPRIYLGGSWRIPSIVFAGPVYVRRLDGGVTVYEYDLSGRYMEYIGYYGNGTIVHGVVDASTGRPLILLRGRVEAVFWMGNWTTYILHGAYPSKKGFDSWSGFWIIARA